MITKRRPKNKRPEMYVYLFDEAPRIGCGWRGVNITKRGRKWTRIKEVSTGFTGKLANAVWAQIERRVR